MSTIYLGLVSFLTGGLGRRIAGGGFQDLTGLDVGDLPVRLFYGLTVALAALYGGAVWWVALLMIPAVWVGTTTGNFESLCMGNQGHDLEHDAWGMTAHGVLSAILPGLLVGWAVGIGAGAMVFLVISATATPSYMIGWRVWNSYPFHTFGDFLSPPTPMAEFIWGGCTALVVYLAFVV